MTGRTLLSDWAEKLIDAGIVPPMTRRILIDIPLNDVVKVYYETYADEKMFTAELAVALKKAEVVHVGKAMAGKMKTMFVDKNGDKWKPEPVGVTSELATPDEPVKG